MMKFWLTLFLVFFFGDLFSEKIVFQPQFQWANNTVTTQGTSSFIKTPQGTTVAVTSAHFLDFSGPRLLLVECLDMVTEQTVAVARQSFGVVPKYSYDPLDFTSDYFLMAVDGDFSSYKILDIDERDLPDIGEPVGFPNKNADAQLGYDWIKGKVVDAKNTYYMVILNQKIDLTSRSGTPVLSEKTGKVIGILAAGGVGEQGTILYLAPASCIARAMREAKNTTSFPARGSK